MPPAYLFETREEAGRLLVEPLKSLNLKAPMIYALPRGGVPVAAAIAEALEAPLDLVLVRKLGLPSQPELAFGAVTDGATPQMVVNQDVVDAAGLSERVINTARQCAIAEIERRRALYFDGQSRPNPSGRTVVLVDDGVATGATARASIQSLRHRGAETIVLAAPVAPYSVVQRLGEIADEVVCLEMPFPFGSVGQWYRAFPQLEDDDVIKALRRAPAAGVSG